MADPTRRIISTLDKNELNVHEFQIKSISNFISTIKMDEIFLLKIATIFLKKAFSDLSISRARALSTPA
jgi:hypothetical protein